MYQGHHSDGSGVQKHSAGATYPFVVVVRNDGSYVMAPDGTEDKVATFTANDRVDRVCCIGYAIDAAANRAALYRQAKENR